MHEAGIAAELLSLAEANSNGRQILAVCVRLGAMSAVVAEALEFAFEALKPGTTASRARLVIEPVHLLAVCTPCGKKIVPEADLALWCPRCGSGLDIIAGRELDLAWIEVEDDAERAPCSESP